MSNQTTNSAAITVRFGQAMHMDLSRASDEKLAAAYKTLDEYDTRGEASAYTQDKIDRRLSEIDDEGDRREGVEPAPWNPNPEAHVTGVSSTIAVREVGDANDVMTIFEALDVANAEGRMDDEARKLIAAGFDEATVADMVEEVNAHAAEEVMDDDDSPAETGEEIQHIVSELDPSVTDGLVPGETSAI